MNIFILLPGVKMYGQERATVVLAETLRDLGHDVHFLIHAKWGGDEIGDELSRRGFCWSALPMGTLWSIMLFKEKPTLVLSNLWGVIKSTLKFLSLVRKKKVDLMIVGNWVFFSYIFPSFFLCGVPVVYRHGDVMPLHTAIHRIGIKLLYRVVNYHVVNCDFLRKKLHEIDHSIQLKLIYNLSPIRIHEDKKTPSNNYEKRILFVGQLTTDKGIQVLLSAFDLIHEEFPDLVIDVVGGNLGLREEDAGSEHIAYQFSKRFPGRVKLHGFVSDVSPFYRRALIHVCPSIHEDLSPNVIFEAKAHAIPSIVFSGGGTPELIDHLVDGYICKSPDAECLAEGIRIFLLDPNLRKQAGTAALQSSRSKYGHDRFQTEWSDVLKTATSE